MIEARLARVVGFGVGPMLEMNERHPARTERSAVIGAIDDGEPEHIAVEVGEPVEIADLEADRADMERGATGEGRDGRRVRGVHGSYIDPSAERRNTGLTPSCRLCYRSPSLLG